MATAYRDLGLQLKTCPYNAAHKVKASKFQAHVSNCGQQYAQLGLRVCPFNATHRLPKERFAEHLITCPDNNHILRSDALKTDKTEAKEEEEEDYRMKGKDIWSDQYLEKTSSKNYDILCDSKVTAEWLFNKRFGDGVDTSFTDGLYIQRMSYEERKKYQMMSVQKIKEMNENKEKNDFQLIDQNQNIKEKTADQSMAPVMDKDLQIVDIRAPNIQNPFAKGVNPLSTEFIETFRGAGIGRGLGGVLPPKGNP